ncbi:putative RNA-directed DNA polymerase, eukaryota, reverse transcriptase zinc-binding domain protein [Tanacetum coccineum]
MSNISNLPCIVLEKGNPDHRSILLKEFEVDGLIPFQFFHSWLDVDGFHDLVGDTWNNDGIVDMNGLTSFKKKLQNLKQDIRKWVASKKFDSQKLRKDHQHWLSSIDAKVDQGCAREEDIINRIVLEKGIPGHRSILLKESEVDGPIPFQFFHSWLDVDGFHDLVGDTWNNDGIVHMNGLTSFKKKLQNLKQDIWKWVASKKFDSRKLRKDHQHRLSSIYAKVDQGCAREEDIINRKHSSTFLGDLDRLEAKDLAQKAKIKWALEGDENTSFFHGTTRFQQPTRIPPSLDADSLTPFSPRSRWIHVQVFTTFWDLLEDDVVRFVQEFFRTNTFPKGCNSSFIALIPKVSSAKFVIDFCPISIIRFQYKIIGKNLANRLSTVVRSCISSLQSAFIQGRYILDGPLILNEVLAWYRDCKKELMVFKVDFEKAFDSLHWEWESTRFWNDTWCGNLPLKWQYPRIYLLDININCFISNRVSLLDWHSVLRRYPRGGAEMSQLVALQASIGNVTLTHQCGSWMWSIDVPAVFSVAPVRALLDVHTLDLDPVATR